MNKKGFTLIELLVTISIMALILILVMPSITALRSSNESRSYEYYGEAMVEAAKVYVTKEGEDINSLGAANWTGCVDITYADLIAADLIAPYSDEKFDCSAAVVRYTKGTTGKDNSYQYNMTCKQISNNETVFTHNEFNINNTCSVTSLDK